MNAHTMAPERRIRYLAVVVLVGLAFFASYAYAAAYTRSRSGVGPSAAQDAGLGAPGSGSASCSCCGGGGNPTGEPITGTATVEGGVQRIHVDVSQGYYDPDTIVLAAGVPAEITFSQSGGCTAQVISEQLGFSEDLTAGPRTVKLPALEAGEYEFSCGMRMVFGRIVVE